MVSTLFRRCVAGFVALTVIGIATIAAAHHGWNSFDTSRAYYATGTIVEVHHWGNPHSEIVMRVESTALPEGWLSRELPQGSNSTYGPSTMASARPYDAGHDEIELVLAGPEWMRRWGLDRAIEVGEKLEVVGYLGSSDSQALRPVMFWLADGQGVWQQLTSFPQRPEPAGN